MIRLNRRTYITQAGNPPMDFPKYTFSLVPIDRLSNYLNKTDRFLDVIGRIIRVSNIATFITSSGKRVKRRVVQLQDLCGNMVELSISGKRATEFDGERVLEVGQKNYVIAIFVGTLMKLYIGKHEFLSGTSACRWYINENDIPEIKAFQRSLVTAPVAIQSLYLPNEDDTLQNLEQRTLLQLRNIDPFTEKGKRYECKATIIGIKEQQTWCYRACKVCNSKILIIRGITKCSRESCTCTQFDWKYKIPFLASDETYSLEFMFFERRAVELIGKSAETLRKQHEPDDIPPEIRSWIGFKFVFVVSILSTKSINAVDPSFEVIRIKENLGKQPIIPPQFGILPSTSVTAPHQENLPQLIPITSKKAHTQNLSSQAQAATDIEYMQLDPSGIWDDTDHSNKRNFENMNEANEEETNPDSDDDTHGRQSKRFHP